MKVFGGAILLLVGALAVVIGYSYNGFVSAEENVTREWAQVENQMQRRADLIPNLVQVVKGYAEHEEAVLSGIADARSRLSGSVTLEEKMRADQEVTSALGRLLVIVENYPDLKADTQFTGLRDELAGSENRLAVARRAYNESVTEYNKRIRQFPGIMTARWLGFERKDVYDIKEDMYQVPEVQFGTD